MPKKKVNDVKAEIKKIVKKKKRKVYFGIEVQEAIVDYNSSTDDSENHSQNTRVPKNKDEQKQVDNLKAKFDELFAS